MASIVADGHYLGAEPTDQDRYVQSMAPLQSGGFIAVWDNQSGTGGIFGQILNDAGVEVGSPIQLSPTGGQPSVTGLSSGGFALSWRDGENGALITRVFDGSGAPSSDATQLSAIYVDKTQSIGVLDGYVVGWSNYNGVQLRTFDADGTAQGNGITVSTGRTDFSLADLDDGRVLIAYGGQNAGEPFRIAVKTFNPVNSSLSADPLISVEIPGGVSLGAVQVTQLASGEILVSWVSQTAGAQELRGALFTLAGVATGETFAIETGLAYLGTQVAALDDGGFVVAYKTPGDFFGSAVVAQLFDSDAKTVGAAFAVSEPGEVSPRAPTVTAFGTNDFAIGWSYDSGSASDSSVRSYFSIGAGLEVLPEQLIGTSEFRLFASSGQAASVAGTGTVFGATGHQEITVLPGTSGLVFDPSFNRGGDIVRLPGEAKDYFVFVSGSTALFFNGETSVSIPVGTAGMAVVFDDGARNLMFDRGASAVTIGGQAVTETLATVAAAPDVPTLPTGVDPDATGRLFLAASGEATIGGTMNVFGSNSAEELVFAGGDAVLDSSFNRGGDTVRLIDTAQSTSAYRSGSSVVLRMPHGNISIPVGTAGTVLDFAGDEYILRYDAATSTIKIGSQEISTMGPDISSQLAMASLAAPVNGVLATMHPAVSDFA